MRLAVLIERLTPALAPFVTGALMLFGALATGADVTVALVALARPWGWAAAAAVILSAVCKCATRANRRSVKAILARVEAGEAGSSTVPPAAD